MNASVLMYADLSKDTIKKFHKERGGILVELSPFRGRVLLALLERRDRVEKDLLYGKNFARLIWNNFIWSIYELNARLFHAPLLDLQNYVKFFDASHGWEMTPNGNQLFMLFPINKDTEK